MSYLRSNSNAEKLYIWTNLQGMTQISQGIDFQIDIPVSIWENFLLEASLRMRDSAEIDFETEQIKVEFVINVVLIFKKSEKQISMSYATYYYFIKSNEFRFTQRLEHRYKKEAGMKKEDAIKQMHLGKK